jgi:uncharacterized protein YjbI with pentapeptide repeats
MKFEIKNRFTGGVQITAEIECDENASNSDNLGLAVKWAIKSGADLSRADLSSANLFGANLFGANLSGANLSGANLFGANLSSANLFGANLFGANLFGAYLSRAYLSRANLSGADLSRADLSSAYLSRAYLSRANLSGADLSRADLSSAYLSRADLFGANLSGADLSSANLSGADLFGADLFGANLSGANGVNDYVKCIQVETYAITYTSDVLQIGCEKHAIDEWRDFDDARIVQMDGNQALKFWRKYKDWIFAIIELCPAKPTKGEPTMTDTKHTPDRAAIAKAKGHKK